MKDQVKSPKKLINFGIPQMACNFSIAFRKFTPHLPKDEGKSMLSATGNLAELPRNQEGNR